MHWVNLNGVEMYKYIETHNDILECFTFRLHSLYDASGLQVEFSFFFSLPAPSPPPAPSVPKDLPYSGTLIDHISSSAKAKVKHHTLETLKQEPARKKFQELKFAREK